MILTGKKVVIMGIRNKWSIAWGAAQSAYEQGAQVIFTCGSMEKMDKIKELTDSLSEFKEELNDCLGVISFHKFNIIATDICLAIL